MPDLWAAAARLVKDSNNTQIWKWCGKFNDGEKRKQPMRLTDRYCAGSISTLNKRMFAMTFRGMQMLHLIYSPEPSGFCILPMTEGNHAKPVLLETMPGLVLSAMGLPYWSYKGKDETSKRNRACIWENLGSRSGIEITSEKKLKLDDNVKKSDDCLDSVVAAVAAALWHIDQDIFHCPPMQDRPRRDAILKEGWLYTPCPSRLPVCIDE